MKLNYLEKGLYKLKHAKLYQSFSVLVVLLQLFTHTLFYCHLSHL